MRNKWKSAALPGIFALWCAARSIWYFAGKHYRGAAEAVYSGFPALKTADIAFAVLLLTAAAYWIISALKKRALQYAPVIMAALELAYGVARFIITGFTPLNLQSGLRIAAYICIFIYYRKESGGENHARGENPVCSGSLLQGGSGAAGDGEAPEGEDEQPDSSGENIG